MTCQICDIIGGKIKAKKLYEDDDLLAVLNPKPSVFGHALVFPKKHLTIIQQVPEEIVKKMFFIAQQLSGIIFDAVGAEGRLLLRHRLQRELRPAADARGCGRGDRQGATERIA